MIEGSSADHWLSMMTAFGVRPCLATASSDARMVHDAPSVICEELPAVTWPQGRSNTGFSFARLLRRGIRPHAVVVIVEFAVARERGFDLALEKTLRLRVGQPLVAFDRVSIRLLARDAEEMTDHFGGLSHVEFGDRIGQPALKADDRLEISRTRLRDRRELAENALGAGQPREPAHALLRPDQRRVAQRFRTAGQDQIRRRLRGCSDSRCRSTACRSRN